MNNWVNLERQLRLDPRKRRTGLSETQLEPEKVHASNDTSLMLQEKKLLTQIEFILKK